MDSDKEKVLKESISFFKDFKNNFKDFYNSDSFIYTTYNNETNFQFMKMLKAGIIKDEYVFKKELKTDKKIDDMNYEEIMYFLAELFCTEKFVTGIINENIKNGNIVRSLEKLSELNS